MQERIIVCVLVTLQASITVQSSVTVKYRYSEKCGPETGTTKWILVKHQWKLEAVQIFSWAKQTSTIIGLVTKYLRELKVCKSDVFECFRFIVCVNTLFPNVLFPLKLGLFQSNLEHWNRKTQQPLRNPLTAKIRQHPVCCCEINNTGCHLTFIWFLIQK